MFSWTTVTLLMSGMWAFLKPVIFMLLNEVTEEIIEYVKNVVTELKDVDLSSSEKREKAFETIQAKLEESGDSLTDSTINLLIEITVNRLKDKD